MRIEKIVEWLLEMNPADTLAVVWYSKDHMEELLDRKLTDAQWEWLAEDIGYTWYLTDYDIQSYIEALDEEFGKSE
jgi:hypothetical protein